MSKNDTPLVYKCDRFAVWQIQRNNEIVLIQKIFHPVIHTSDLPLTYGLLDQKIKSVFYNECFNSYKLPFKVEVQATEIGHLFEHLILEYLKIIAENKGLSVCFSGETSWDWQKLGYGVFRIDLNLPVCVEFLPRAVKDAAELLNRLYTIHDWDMETSRPEFFPTLT